MNVHRLTISSDRASLGRQRFALEADDLDSAITAAQRALLEIHRDWPQPYSASDYAGVSWLKPGTSFTTSTGVTFALEIARQHHEPYPLLSSCPRCGQQSPHEEVCPSCRRLEREPQGTQDALFTPAPAPMAGQLTL